MIKKLIVYGLSACLYCSCQSAHELHYFKQGDNYYRIRVKENAFLSSSRYQSGHYDETAVDKYFGEIRRPDTTGNVLQISQDSSGNISANPSNTKLIMILSTKTEVISDQIAAFAENEQTLEMIARLANKDVIAKNQQIKSTIELKRRMTQSVVDYGDITLNKLDSTMDRATIYTKVLLFVNQLASNAGRKQPFANLDEAYTWYLETL